MGYTLLPKTIEPQLMQDEVVQYLDDLGFRFGRPDPETPDLYHCELPAGWMVRSSGTHTYHELCDSFGRVRFVACLRLTADDSECFLQAQRAVVVEDNLIDSKGKLSVRVSVLIWGEEVCSVECDSESAEELLEVKSVLLQDINSWVKETFPDFQKIDAYWDPDGSILWSD